MPTRKTFILTLLLLFAALTHYAQTVREWAGSGNWSLVTNWTPEGNPAQNWLHFTGGGNVISFNDQTGQWYRRILFTAATQQSYSISGNQITLRDPSAGNFGYIGQESDFQQNITAPVLFDEAAKAGFIFTRSLGKLVMNKITLGATLDSLVVGGLFTEGDMIAGDTLAGTRPLVIGRMPDASAAPNTRMELLVANPNFTGPIRVLDGTLVLKNSRAAGISATNRIDISTLATVEIDGGLSFNALNSKTFNLSGNGLNNINGNIRSTTGNNSIETDILLSNNARIRAEAGSSLTVGAIGKFSGNPALNWNIIFSGFGAINVNGVIGKEIVSGQFVGNLIKQDSGWLTINVPANYKENTNINGGGKLRLGAANVLPSGSKLILNAGEFSTGQTVGFSQSLGALSISGGDGIITLGTGYHELTFANSRSEVWSAGRTLLIRGWKGLAGEASTPGTAKIFITPQDGSTAGLTEEQLLQVQFEGSYCRGGKILPTGELVPSDRPFINNVTGSQPHTSVTLSHSGYIGSTISIFLCSKVLADSIQIGGRIFKPGPGPDQYIQVDSSLITYTLTDTVNGLITVYTSNGSRTNTIPLVNLGYITRMNAASAATGVVWNTDSIWLGRVIPVTGRNVTIAHNNIVASPVINVINPVIPYTNTLSMVAGGIRLAANQAIPANTPLHLSGGQLRVFNRSQAIANTANPGFSQDFHSLTLSASASILLDSVPNRPSYGILRFGNSNHLPWSPGAILNIINWAGEEAKPGTRYRIFVGNSDTGLTRDQLRQIKFGDRCQGAKLLPDGELVPSDAPFISTLAGKLGGPDKAYYGDTVTLRGCKFQDVDTIRIGSLQVPSFTLMDTTSLWFIIGESFPEDRISLATRYRPPNPPLPDTPSKVGISGNIITRLGYASRQNGNWTQAQSWLGDFIPSPAERVTLFNAITVNNEINNSIDSLVITATGAMDFSGNGSLQVSRFLVNNGTIMPTGPGRLNLSDGCVITNNSVNFRGNGNLTVNLLGSATLTGSQPVTFHNLILNTGQLIIPAFGTNSSSAATASTIPLIAGEFRINGGRVVNASGNIAGGPRYLSNSTLTYATGLYYRRGREWNPIQNTFVAPPDNIFGRPHNVLITNGTQLVLDGLDGLRPPSSISPRHLSIHGNLVVQNGTLRIDGLDPLEIFGDFEIGTSPDSRVVVNMGRLANEDPVVTSSFLNNANNHIRLHGNFVRWVNSSFNYRENRQPIFLLGNTRDTMRFPGVTAPAGDTLQSFYTITMDKPGGMQVDGRIGIRTALNLTNGVLEFNNLHFIRIEGAAAVNGGNPNSFIHGKMHKVTAATPANAAGPIIEFKVGKRVGVNLLYRPVVLSDIFHSGTTVYEAEFFNSVTNDGISFNTPPYLDPNLQGVWVNNWWEVNRVSGAGDARVGVYNDPSLSFTPAAPCNTCNVSVAKYEAGSWRFTKNEDNFNNTQSAFPETLKKDSIGLVFSSVQETFSPFTMGFGFDVLLPLQLISFTATLHGPDGLLQWKLADTKDLGYFDVEHSTDGRTFSRIGTVQWQERKEFSYRHLSLSKGTHYYRLRMVEKDGRSAFSRIEMLQVGKAVTAILGLLQNPVQSHTAQLRVFSAIPQLADIQVIDMAGRVLVQHKITLPAGNAIVPVMLPVAAKGMYRMQVRTADGASASLPLLQ